MYLGLFWDIGRGFLPVISSNLEALFVSESISFTKTTVDYKRSAERDSSLDPKIVFLVFRYTTSVAVRKLFLRQNQ